MRILLAAALLFAANAAAQVIALGTTQIGATFQLSTGIAKVVSDKSGMQMRTQPMAGAVQYAPLVNRGDIEFGMSNVPELHYLSKGEIIAEGRPNPELRMAARLVPWYNGLIVKKDSPIRSIKDLKGQPMPAGFPGNPLGKVLITGYLANAGLTFEDTRQVPVPSFPRMWDSFKQQQTAASIATIGMSQLQELQAALDGVRFISFDSSPAAVSAMQKHVPYSYVVEVKPGPGKIGIDAPTNMLVYDYALWVNAKVKNEVVAKVVETLYSNPTDIKATSPLWTEFDPAQMGKDVGIAYHPGAVAFYKSKGIVK
ncbi:MAG: TAXI family TRAP transporter solute-binding subunit [Betaproteobacteria bacterium]